MPESLRGQIVALARGRYAGLNDHHLTEKLTTVEGLTVPRATVRRILRAAGVVSPRRRRPPRPRSRRPRKAQVGLLLQLDGSPFQVPLPVAEARYIRAKLTAAWEAVWEAQATLEKYGGR